MNNAWFVVAGSFLIGILVGILGVKLFGSYSGKKDEISESSSDNGIEDAADGNINSETLEFIFNYTKDAPEQLIKDAEALDDKMIRIFSAASIVIGLAGISNTAVSGEWVNWLLAIALSLYLITAVVAFLELMPKAQNRSLHADKLWDKFWQEDIVSVQHSLVDNISEAYIHNTDVVKKKGLALKITAVTVPIEVLLVGAALLLSRFS